VVLPFFQIRWRHKGVVIVEVEVVVTKTPSAVPYHGLMEAGQDGVLVQLVAVVAHKHELALTRLHLDEVRNVLETRLKLVTRKVVL
jgi:hypothetical protein